jgi:hypothetical protein
MISCSSSLASSTPATSLNVTFLPDEDVSLARDLPNESARLPPDCIWRMKKIHTPRNSTIGAQVSNIVSVEPFSGFSAVTTTFWLRRVASRSSSSIT